MKKLLLHLVIFVESYASSKYFSSYYKPTEASDIKILDF